MIAYNKTWLNNLFVREEVEKAYELDCISKEERDKAWLAFPSMFYSPNIFIRIGLFLLTVVVMLFSFGLFSLMFLTGIEKTIGGLLIFFAMICIAGLEVVIHNKKHYQSGIDTALMWGGAIALFSGIGFTNDLSGLANACIIFMIALVCVLRYADTGMAALCFISLLAIIFFFCGRIGGTAKAILPFIVMTISVVVYVLAKKISDSKSFNVYRSCVVYVEIISLFTLYAAGNYWVVRETSNEMFNLNLQPGQTIPFGFIFWIFTIFIPLIYLFRGIQKKDVVLIRVGLLLVAAIVFTIRYYHAILLPEIAMVLAGGVMIIFAWALTRWLASPKYGFTAEELRSKNAFGNMQIESLILAETFSQQPQPTSGTQFGGGSFGGGGSSGEF